jgi:hypothetical protein
MRAEKEAGAVGGKPVSMDETQYAMIDIQPP